MAKKAFILFVTAVFLLNNLPLYSSEPLSLNYLIKQVRQDSPEVLAAKKRWEASLARIPQQKSLENPTIGIGFEKTPRGSLRLDKTMPDDRMLTFSQFFPLFGKLSLKGKIAVVESQMLAAQYKAKELEAINQVTSAYYALFMNYKEAQLTQESLKLLESIARVAEARYALGEMAQEEVYKIDSEIAILHNTLLNLKEEKKAKEARLNTLLNRDPESALGAPELSEGAAFSEDIRTLYQLTTLNQPELLIFSYAIEKNKYAKSLAKRSFFPDLMASLAQRGIASGTLGPWDLMLAFSLPLWFWTKQRYEVKEAVASLEEAEYAYKAMRNRAFSEVKDLSAKIEIAKNKIKLYKASLIPVLKSSIESSLAGFRSGRGDFMMLLDSQRMLIAAEMDYYRAVVEYHMNLADLKTAVGMDLK